jgi:hypothetical protein
MGLGAGGITGSGGVFEQFAIWGILSQLISPVLAPIVQQIADETWPRLPSTPLSPELLADLVLKGWMVKDPDGYEAAAASGISSDKFDQMVNDAGEPIALDALLEAFRRGIIPWSSDVGDNSVETGIRTSRVRDQWTSVIQQLATIIIPVGDVVSATVKGQITMDQGVALAALSGLSSDDFTILFNTAGNPPGPGELSTLARRGIIPVEGQGADVLSLHQGIIEGLTKDKWWPAYQALLVYLPPPRTVTALERAGAITPTEAQTLYQQQGLSSTLAAAYSADASAVKLVKTKELAEGQVIDLFKAKIIQQGDAESMLGDLGYTAAEATLILEYASLAAELKAYNSAVSKVGTLYMARKIGATTAAEALSVLGVPASTATALIADWGLERAATVRLLTPAEIGDAVKYAIMDQPTGQSALEALGYEPYDAWVRLSLSQDGPLPDQPAVPTDTTGALP